MSSKVDQARLKDLRKGKRCFIIKIRVEFAEKINIRQKLEGQLRENEIVLEELTKSNSDALLYKLIGPCLIKQDLFEAKSHVEKRLKFIRGEV